ncbi:MAG: hypothetical protein ACI8TQ_003477 [Planctomycetota bacterium]|jgi:hypothetical protein
MSAAIALLAEELLASTREVLHAIDSDFAQSDIDALLASQTEAFSKLSRHRDAAGPLAHPAAGTVTEVLSTIAAIVERTDEQHRELTVKDRSLSKRMNQVSAFQANVQPPPQFITRRV